MRNATSTNFSHPLLTINTYFLIAGTGVTVNALHPGIVYTDLGRHMGVANSILAQIFVQPLFKFLLKTPVQGSYTSLYVALEPSLETTTGKYFR